MADADVIQLFPDTSPATAPSPLELERPLHERTLLAVPDPEETNEFPTFEERIRTRVGGASLRGTIETPYALDDPNDLLWIQGFMAPEVVYRPPSHEATQHGRRSVTIGRAGLQLPHVLIHPKHFLKFEKVTQQSPGAILKQLSPQVDIVAHSMGLPIAVETILRNPGRVRSLTAVGGAGLTGHGAPDLAARVPKAIEEVARNMPRLIEMYGVAAALAITQYFCVNPLRPLAESLYVARSDVREDLPRIRAAGTRISIIALEPDSFFGADRMYEETKGKVDRFTVLASDIAGHIAPQVLPKPVAAAVVNGINEIVC
jgi:pimeloyl-ACP methyl ester carboxylesterase